MRCALLGPKQKSLSRILCTLDSTPSNPGEALFVILPVLSEVGGPGGSRL